MSQDSWLRWALAYSQILMTRTYKAVIVSARDSRQSTTRCVADYSMFGWLWGEGIRCGYDGIADVGCRTLSCLAITPGTPYLQWFPEIIQIQQISADWEDLRLESVLLVLLCFTTCHTCPCQWEIWTSQARHCSEKIGINPSQFRQKPN